MLFYTALKYEIKFTALSNLKLSKHEQIVSLNLLISLVLLDEFAVFTFFIFHDGNFP